MQGHEPRNWHVHHDASSASSALTETRFSSHGTGSESPEAQLAVNGLCTLLLPNTSRIAGLVEAIKLLYIERKNGVILN